ncbi:MAG: hypothetical protein ACTSU9_19345 [Promethearchaeota archaeon]
MSREISISCPTCSSSQVINVPGDAIAKDGGISTVAIEAACGHRFLIFIDNDLKVRGYQSADIVLISEIVKIEEEISSILDSEGIKLKQEGSLRNFFNERDFLEHVDIFFKALNYSDPYSRKVVSNAGEKVEAETVVKTEAGTESRVTVIKSESKATPMELIKRTYGIRVKQLEDAILKLEISTIRDENILSESELKEKREKLMELKGKMQDYFEEFLRNAPS